MVESFQHAKYLHDLFHGQVVIQDDYCQTEEVGARPYTVSASWRRINIFFLLSTR